MYAERGVPQRVDGVIASVGEELHRRRRSEGKRLSIVKTVYLLEHRSPGCGFDEPQTASVAMN